ncbi:hypothetical protein D3C76_1199910 [compost metagenome]
MPSIDVPITRLTIRQRSGHSRTAATKMARPPANELLMAPTDKTASRQQDTQQKKRKTLSTLNCLHSPNI